MSIKNASIPVGATFTPSGGTATTLLDMGASDKTIVLLDDGSDFLVQTTMNFDTKAPKVSVGAPNGYTQARNSVLVQVPRILANGNRTVDTIRIEVSCDPETDDTEKGSMRELGAHVLLDSDFAAFWNDQSRA